MDEKGTGVWWVDWAIVGVGGVVTRVLDGDRDYRKVAE